MNRNCDFWLWSYFKSIVYGDTLNSLAKSKDAIHMYVRNISPDLLRATADNAVMCINFLSDIGRHHIEHVLKICQCKRFRNGYTDHIKVNLYLKLHCILSYFKLKKNISRLLLSSKTRQKWINQDIGLKKRYWKPFSLRWHEI